MRYLILLPLFAATPAHAHLGHVAEVAGHAHWIGLAAAAGAAAIAGALIGKLAGEKKEEAEEKPEEAEEQPA